MEKLFNAQELLDKITKGLSKVDDLLNYSDEEIWFDTDDVSVQVAYDNKPDEGFMVYVCFNYDEGVIKKPLYHLLEEWMKLFTYADRKYDREETTKYLNDLDDIASKLREKVASVGFHGDNEDS